MEKSSDIVPTMLPADYRPSESEEFMNPMQLLYFRKKLEAWKAGVYQLFRHWLDVF